MLCSSCCYLVYSELNAIRSGSTSEIRYNYDHDYDFDSGTARPIIIISSSSITSVKKTKEN